MLPRQTAVGAAEVLRLIAWHGATGIWHWRPADGRSRRTLMGSAGRAEHRLARQVL